MRVRTISTLFALMLSAVVFAWPEGAAASPDLAATPASRAAAVSGSAPVFDVLNDMAVTAGQTQQQLLHATDADGDPLSFYKVSGPAYVTVSTTDAGSGSATGLITLQPTESDVGAVTVYVGVSDGALVATRSLRVTVSSGNAAPVLTQPSAMSLTAGQVANQALYASDANGDPVTFGKVSGPSFMTVTTVNAGGGSATGNVNLAPQTGLSGSYIGTVSATDGTLADSKSFAITVLSAGHPPYLSSLYSMTLRAGSTADQSLYATDTDGDAVTFSKSAGPAYMTVSTSSPGSGYAYGNLHLAPGTGNAGTTTGTVRATDATGLFYEQSLGITVTPPDRPPVLSQPADMDLMAGEVKQQTVTATDPDGDYLNIGRNSGPSWVSVSYGSGSGTATSTVSVAPGPTDVGAFQVTLYASANSLYDYKSFAITVRAPDLPAACPSGSFSRVATQFGYGVIEIQTADLNGDGILDVVAEMPSADRATIAFGVGDGSFASPIDLQAGYDPVSGAIADYNRDGAPDVAILDSDGSRIYVFLGDGAGGFGPRKGFTVPSYTRYMVTADVNRDGKADLLVSCPDARSVAILRGNGDGTFGTAVSLSAGYAAWGLATPDLNGDGAPDLVVVNAGDDDITVYLNNGSGSFLSRTDYPVGDEPYLASAADLDGDGDQDVVVSNGTSNSVTVLFGRGDGTLGGARSFSTGTEPRQIVLADLNGDQHLDIAVPNLYSNTVSILLGDGTGTFGARTNIAVGDDPYGLVTGDFNDDLRPDLAVAEYYGGSVSVLLNSCAPARDHPPVAHAPKSASGGEGAPIAFIVTATDPDGPAITSLTASFAGLPLGNTASFTANPAEGSGQFSWTPSYNDARPTAYPVTFTATNVLSGTATTLITVTNTNRAPLSNAGGPYSGLVGYALALDGSASADPDGDAMAYSWLLGDGTTATGVKPVHTYAAAGTYPIALTVSDGALTGLSVTTATVVDVLEARLFSNSHSIKLSAGKPEWSVNLEAVGGSFTAAEVDPHTIVMKSPGTGTVSEIHAVTDKTLTTVDKDGNGIPEIVVPFAKSDLRLLFANLSGTSTVTVTVEGRLFSGGIFRGRIDIEVNASGGKLAASISPNPLNPEAVLTFRTRLAGPARVALFDVAGRLVGRPLDEIALAAGYHDVRISGRGSGGQSLPSGLYFYRIETAEGVETGRFTILK
ncbi:MAG: FG-GAP-like repeat-containing protein [Bacteroidota bacterium]